MSFCILALFPFVFLPLSLLAFLLATWLKVLIIKWFVGGD